MSAENMKNGVTGYVQPNDAGLHSEPRAVGRRIAKMLDALADNANIMSGPIEKDCFDFRMRVIGQLRADGWEVKVNARDKFEVKPGKAYWASLRGAA